MTARPADRGALRGCRGVPLAAISSRAWAAHGTAPSSSKAASASPSCVRASDAPPGASQAGSVEQLRPRPFEGHGQPRVERERLAEVAVDVVVDQATAPAGGGARPRPPRALRLLGQRRQRAARVAEPSQPGVGLDQVRLPHHDGGLGEAGLTGEIDQRLEMGDGGGRPAKPLIQQPESEAAIGGDRSQAQLLGQLRCPAHVRPAVVGPPERRLDRGQGDEREAQGPALAGLLQRPHRLRGAGLGVPPATAPEVQLGAEGLGRSEEGEGARLARAADPPRQVSRAAVEVAEPGRRRERHHQALPLGGQRVDRLQEGVECGEGLPRLPRPAGDGERARVDDGDVGRPAPAGGQDLACLLKAAQRLAAPAVHGPCQAGAGQHLGRDDRIRIRVPSGPRAAAARGHRRCWSS